VPDESEVDRIFRQADEKADAGRAETAKNREFLSDALDRVVPIIKGEISAGLERALGAVRRSQRVHTGPNGATISFNVMARNAKHGTRAIITVTLVGGGPEFTERDLVHYSLDVAMVLRHRSGASPGPKLELRVNPNGLGDGRPSISASDVQHEVEAEIQKRLGFGVGNHGGHEAG
jgi:hypothetical protein